MNTVNSVNAVKSVKTVRTVTSMHTVNSVRTVNNVLTVGSVSTINSAVSTLLTVFMLLAVFAPLTLSKKLDFWSIPPQSPLLRGIPVKGLGVTGETVHPCPTSGGKNRPSVHRHLPSKQAFAQQANIFPTSKKLYPTSGITVRGSGKLCTTKDDVPNNVADPYVSVFKCFKYVFDYQASFCSTKHVFA